MMYIVTAFTVYFFEDTIKYNLLTELPIAVFITGIDLKKIYVSDVCYLFLIILLTCNCLSKT